jgi:magnesium chelatase subunit D
MMIASSAGLSDAVIAAVLLAIDPTGLGGAVLRGPCEPEGDAWLTFLRNCLPANAPVRKLPVHADVDRLVGGLDLSATLNAGRPVLERGILSGVDGGLLILPSAERCAPEKAAILAATMDAGRVSIERDGFRAAEPARFMLVACDEGASEDERTPGALMDRLAFHLEAGNVEIPNLDPRMQIESARHQLSDVAVPDAIVAALCEAANALGIGSLRSSLFAMKAARALAAFDGRRTASEDDAILAARLVIAPRAAVIAQTVSDEEAAKPDHEAEAADASDEPRAADQPLSDVILEAVKAALPPGLLAGLAAGQAMRAAGRAGAGAAARRNKTRRGRPAGTRAGDLRRGARLNLIATLRAAAPWQRLRRPKASDSTSIKVRREDFRVTRTRQRSETTAIFAVDASGSAAFHRLAEAKGAVELILAECYIRRDKAALVAFRGNSAEILLPPTRSLERARRCLSALPGGGGTPLSAGIDACALLADQVRRGGGTPVLVFLTDGRANIARNGTANRSAAMQDALSSARLIRAAGHTALLIDVSPAPHESAQTLAHEMRATYLPLPHARAHTISRAVSDAMPS